MNSTIEKLQLGEKIFSSESHQCANRDGMVVLDAGILRAVQETQCTNSATFQTIKTCCGTVSYLCDEHAGDHPDVDVSVCRSCQHACFRGVCYHRVRMPL